MVLKALAMVSVPPPPESGKPISEVGLTRITGADQITVHPQPLILQVFSWGLLINDEHVDSSPQRKCMHAGMSRQVEEILKGLEPGEHAQNLACHLEANDLVDIIGSQIVDRKVVLTHNVIEKIECG